MATPEMSPPTRLLSSGTQLLREEAQGEAEPGALILELIFRAPGNLGAFRALSLAWI